MNDSKVKIQAISALSELMRFKVLHLANSNNDAEIEFTIQMVTNDLLDHIAAMREIIASME